MLKLFLWFPPNYSTGYVPKFGCAITVFVLKKRTWIGHDDLFCITTKSIPETWVQNRCGIF